MAEEWKQKTVSQKASHMLPLLLTAGAIGAFGGLYWLGCNVLDNCSDTTAQKYLQVSKIVGMVDDYQQRKKNK